jgi:hypothetical protein
MTFLNDSTGIECFHTFPAFGRFALTDIGKLVSFHNLKLLGYAVGVGVVKEIIPNN